MELRDEHSAMAIVVIKEKSARKVLMIKNRYGWIFPKGHVEKNETEEEAAIRECKEESGVDVSKAIRHGKVDEFTIIIDSKEMHVKPEEFRKTFKTDAIRKLISVYCFELDHSQPFVLESGFNSGIFATEINAYRLLAYEENKIALTKAMNKVFPAGEENEDIKKKIISYEK